MTDQRSVGRPVRTGPVRRPTIDTLEPQRTRGKPRTTGDLTCGRCGRATNKIRVRWPDGEICGICFTEAMHTFGRCAQCRIERLLPGRDKEGTPICRDCAGIVRPLMSCDECNTEAERFRRGRCVRCVILGDLEAVLKPNEPADLRLKKLIAILVDSRRPESIHTWMQGKKAKELLTSIGNRELQLTHEAFDALPYSSALEHIRAILVDNRLMVIPVDPYLRRFELWLDGRLHQLADTPSVASTIEQFATWHHLKRLRKNVADPSRDMDISTRTARQEITEAGKFLLWLHEQHGLGPAQMTQWHIDLYLSEGPTTRKVIRNFISWFARGRGGKRKLYVPPRYKLTEPIISRSQHLQLIRNAIEMDRVALSTRIAALIHLFWATPLVRVTMLKVDCIQLNPTGMTITLGTAPATIPEQLAPLFYHYVSNRSNQQPSNGATDWMFPGIRAGHHISSMTLQRRLPVLGIDPQRARNAGLKSLLARVNVAPLADLLGYSPITLANHAERSGAYMTSYAEAKRTARQEGAPIRARFNGPSRQIVGRDGAGYD